MCNVVQYAFGAYKDPEVEGYVQETFWGASIHHLNPDLTNAAVDGVLKIRLKSGQTSSSNDGWWGKSDPYVVFSAGDTRVQSPVISNSSEPVWDSTHYLLLKKSYLRSDFDGKLKITLFDDDSQSGFLSSVANYLNQDDFVGTAQIDLTELKKPGIHSFDLELAKGIGSAEKVATVSFTTELLSFKQAWKEMGIRRSRAESLSGLGSSQDLHTVTSDLYWIVELSHLHMEPFAFIDVPYTDTQAWLHVNASAKTMIISFRGTEGNKIRDILVDLTAYGSRLDSTCYDTYTLEPTETLQDEDIRVHSGFLEAYESIREAILQTVYDLTDWSEDWRICVTGHSLGGALATISAFELANRKSLLLLQAPTARLLSF